MSMGAETVYKHQLADGTIEIAMSAEEVFKRCPVLGKLALEAPEEANMLLELSALGNQKLDNSVNEETIHKQPENTSAEKIVADNKPKLEVLKSIISSLPEVESITPKAVKSTQQEIIVNEEIKQEASKIIEKLVMPVKKKVITTKPTIKIINTVQPKTKNPPAKSPIQPKDTMKKIVEINQLLVPAEIRDEKAVKQTEITEPIQENNDVFVTEEPVLISDEIIKVAEKIAIPEMFKTLDLAQTEISNQVEKSELPIYEADEVYKVFIQLKEVEKAQTGVTELTSEVKQPIYPDFVTFIELRAEEPEITSFNVIRVNSETQPADEILAEVANIMTNKPELVPKDVQNVLEELSELIDKNPEQTNQDAKNLFLTLEITEKILVLLKLIGYQNPEQVLLELAHEYGTDFIMQAVEHLCSLNNNKQTSPKITMPSVDSIEERFAKILFILINRQSLNILPL